MVGFRRRVGEGEASVGGRGGEIIIGYRNACLYSLVGMIIVHKFVYSKGFMVLYFWRLGQGRGGDWFGVGELFLERENNTYDCTTSYTTKDNASEKHMELQKRQLLEIAPPPN